MDTEQYDVGFYGLMEHMDTREILAANLSRLRAKHTNTYPSDLSIEKATDKLGYKVGRIPKPWASFLGSATAAGCAAFLAGAPIAYGFGHGAAIGLFLWCVVRLSGDAAKNLK